jgi:hypothetical protein
LFTNGHFFTNGWFNEDIDAVEINMAQAAKTSAREIAMERRRLSYESGKAGIQKMQSSGTQATAAISVTKSVAPAKATRETGNGSAMSTRQLSLARRKAMSTGGKASVVSKDRTRSDETGSATAASTTAASQPATPSNHDCGCGCNGDKSKRPEVSVSASASPTSTPVSAPPVSTPLVQARRGKKIENPARAASLARRVAMSSKGKAALSGKGPSAAQSARASNPNISSRELAQTVREARSKNGKCKTESKCKPTGRMRPGKAPGNESPAAAQDAPWKVGASETSHGQTVTGTMVGRSVSVTGDEPSTCRAVTGTEYLGADIFREFCQTDVAKSPSKVRVTSTGTGNAVSGNELGRSAKVTGNEPGTCKRVTGSQYVSGGQMKEFCGTSVEAGPSKITSAETRKGKSVTGNNVGRSGKVTGDEYGANRELTGTSVMQTGNGHAPDKVGKSATLRGGHVTGTMVGRNKNVTGDEPGSCRNVTGDDYIGQEQYGTFCDTTPKVTDRKVGVSSTLKNKTVTGTMTGRESRVTGNEPGTCKAVTGTPYAGAENYKDYCDTDSASLASARTQQRRATPGMPVTGLQPGIGGKMTGTDKGACEPLTGTPYVGADQFANACPSVPADTSSPDFPQPIGAMGAATVNVPWEQFSVNAPSHASQTTIEHSAVTGTRYEKGHITGPFGMAGGKVTGTEEARFGNGSSGDNTPAPTYIAQLVDDRVKPRISGEGQDAGLRITGDDWDRNDRVTGTEGLSATRRNPTRRGGADAMAMQLISKRNEELPVPSSKVTGSSGNTEKGSLITYSGGARG